MKIYAFFGLDIFVFLEVKFIIESSMYTIHERLILISMHKCPTVKDVNHWTAYTDDLFIVVMACVVRATIFG